MYMEKLKQILASENESLAIVQPGNSRTIGEFIEYLIDCYEANCEIIIIEINNEKTTIKKDPASANA